MAHTSEDVAKAAMEIIKFLISQGEATEEEMLPVLGGKGKKGLLDKALARAKLANAITKVVKETEDGGAAAFWKLMNPDQYRGKPDTAILEEFMDLPTETTKAVYKDYVPFECSLILERPSLGGDPGGESGTLVWPRIQLNGTQEVWVRAKYLQAWLLEGARYAGCSDKMQQALKNKHVQFDDPLISGEGIEQHIIIGPRSTGLIPAEALPIGTKIPIKILYPASVVPAEELILALQTAARMVGFSPSRHYDGWGRGHVEFQTEAEPTKGKRQKTVA